MSWRDKKKKAMILSSVLNAVDNHHTNAVCPQRKHRSRLLNSASNVHSLGFGFLSLAAQKTEGGEESIRLVGPAGILVTLR